MKIAKVKINDFGGAPVAEHNMPCAVCLTEKAVYNLSANLPKSGTFDPCWGCQARGFHLVNVRKLPLLLRWMLRGRLG